MASQEVLERAVIDLLSEIRITDELKMLLDEEIARALSAPAIERRVDRAAITAKLERLGESMQMVCSRRRNTSNSARR